MTTLLFRTLLFVFALASFSSIAADDAVNTGVFSDVAIDGYDTVSYFTENKPVKGDKKLSYEWHGAVWRFSSQENLDLFKQQPEKYAAQYGGYCAWAMSGAKTASGDPEVWHIENNKLYLNYNKNVQKDWFTTMQSDIVSADKNYPEITDVNKYK